MSPLRRPFLLALLVLGGCAPLIDGGKIDSGDSGEPGWVGDPPGGDDGGEEDQPCGETGICQLEIVSATAECGGGNPDRPQLDADVSSDGTITARLIGAGEGCSPQIQASASASVNTDRIDVGLTFYDDFDDCICALDAIVELSGAPSGEYVLVVNGEDTRVTVP
jgi:hypothetical protein